MIPPMIKSDVGTAAMNEIGRVSLSACASASMGDGRNRLPVRRQLFVDNESPENSPPGNWVRQKLADLIVSERQRGIKDYGFDFATDIPCTSSNFTYTVVNPSEVPAFYTQVRGCNTLATFSPKKDRSVISLVPILLPSDLKPSSDQSTSAISIVPETSQVDTSSSSSSSTDVITGVSPKHIDATPLKPKGKKKKSDANDEISGQMLLTSYYPKKRSAAIDSTSSMEKKKRAPTGKNAQGEKSNVVRP